MKHNSKGSSLMESLVVVAIFLVIAAIAIHKALNSQEAENRATPAQSESRLRTPMPARTALLTAPSRH